MSSDILFLSLAALGEIEIRKRYDYHQVDIILQGVEF